jgi:Lon protease-like protein
MRHLPLFPLGNPMVPHAGIPLHVFEERYRRLMKDCLAGDRRFGIVMIERGSEVGGGDVRTRIGTLVEIAEAEELPDGRWVLVAVGLQRFRVVEWLPDDPYPRAVVDLLDDPPAAAGHATRDELERRIRRLAALLAELGEPAPPVDVELSRDPVAAGFQALAVAPVGPLDTQRILEVDDPDQRLEETLAALEEAEQFLRLRLGS